MPSPSHFVLETTPIAFSYGDPGRTNPVLDTGPILMRPGTIYSLYGANMSGKTTLVKILSGHFEPFGFTLSVAGKKTTRHNPVALRRIGIASCHQNDPLFPELSIWDNVRLGCPGRIDDGAAPNQAMRLLREEVLEKKDTLLTPDAPLARLSGGFRTIVRLVRSVAWPFTVALLDEPTVGLDAEMKARFFKTLFRVMDSQKAALFISHVGDEHQVLKEHTHSSGLNYVAWTLGKGKVEALEK